jgi:hypothetical protein
VGLVMTEVVIRQRATAVGARCCAIRCLVPLVRSTTVDCGKETVKPQTCAAHSAATATHGGRIQQRCYDLFAQLFGFSDWKLQAAMVSLAGRRR